MNPEELRRLLDSGEITQEEYYTMLGDRSQSRDERGIPRGETFSRDVMSDPSITGRSPQPLIGRMSPRGFQRVPGGIGGGYQQLSSPERQMGTEYHGGEDERRFFDRVRDNRMERRVNRGDSYPYQENLTDRSLVDTEGMTEEEIRQIRESENYAVRGEREERDDRGGRSPYPYFGAPTLDSTIYRTGMAFGEGNTGAGVIGALGSGLGIARTGLSGFAAARQTQEGIREFQRKSQMQDYENVDTNRNRNTTGGPGHTYEYGGEHKTPAERFNDIMTGKVGHYQNGGRTGEPEKDIKKTEQDPYGAVGITPEDRLHGKFLRVKQREVALPDGSTRMEPEVTDVDRVEGFKEKIRTMFGKEPTKPHLKVTHVYEDGGEIPEQSMEQPVPENEAEQDEILVIAQQLMEEFRTMEEMEAYLRDEGVEPQAIEMILQAVAMIAEEKGSQTEEPLPKSAVMRDTMSGGMDMENMGFKHGGRKYPKL